MAKKKSAVVKNERTSGCITLHDSASMSMHGARIFPRSVLRTAFALLGVCSSFAMLFGFMSVPIHVPTFYISLILSTLFFSEIILTNRRPVILFNTVIVLLVFCGIIRFRTELLFCINEVIDCLIAGMREKPYIRPRLPHDDPFTAEQYLTLGFCLFGSLVSFVVTLFTIYRPKVLLLAVLLYSFVGVGLYNGLHTNSMTVFCWLAYIVGMIVINDSYDNFEHRKADSGFAFLYNNQKLMARPDLRYICSETVACLVAIAVILTGAVSCAATQSETLMDTAGKLRKQVRSKWTDIVDSIADSSVFEHLGGENPSSTTQEDNVPLANRGNPQFDGETVFSASVISSAPLDTLYLKTATYSVYSGTDWQPLPATTYDIWDTLFKTMNNNHSVPQAPLRDENEAYPLARIWYSDTKTYPSTYRMLYDAHAARYFDDDYMLELYNDPTPIYRFEPRYLTNSDALFSSVSYPTASAQDYYHSEDYNSVSANAWQQYDSFARVNYLQVPYSTAMNAIRGDASDLLNSSYSNTADALYAIREYIHSKTEYTLTPERIDEERDFAAAFLLETGEGYCVHYATAGVLLCRMMNIPARFATGYVVFGSDVNENRVQNPDTADVQTLQPGESFYQIDVPDSSSHAWTEIYLPGYGWMPFEFTESYVLPDSPNAQGTGITTTTSLTTTTTTTSTPNGTGSDTSASTSKSTITTTTSTADTTHQRADAALINFLSVLLSLPLLAVAVICLWIVVHGTVYSRRERKMTQPTPDLAAGAAYALLLKVLAFAGITRKPQQSHEDFARLAESLCPYIPEGAMQHAVEIQLAVTFSRDGVTQTQAAEQVAFVHQLIETMYRKMPFHKRFAMRWLNHWVK